MMTKQEIKDTIKESVKESVSEAIDIKTRDFYVDREKHWNHHNALEEFIEFWQTTKKTIWRTFLISIILGMLGIFYAGWRILK